MAAKGISRFAGISRLFVTQRFSSLRYYSIYSPDYLEANKSKIPLHPTINIQIKSFNFPVLESYQKLIDVLAENLDIEIENSWAFPPKCLKITRFKPQSSTTIAEYALNEYQRHIQIEATANQYPILLRAMEASLPSGVTLVVEYYNPDLENKRYVPDTELLNLKEELETIQRK